MDAERNRSSLNKMSSNFIFVVKSIVYSTLIIGGGYATMILVTPTPDQMRMELEKYRVLHGLDETKSDKNVYR